MRVINARNPHRALREACWLLRSGDERETRAGKVKQVDNPVTTVYECPLERVVFWPSRDANPFFHLFEGLWMLAGRNDVDWVARMNPRMREFSDDGRTLHGAYGHRWRKHFGFDQVEAVACALTKNPGCRRQVLTMWDPASDVPPIGTDSAAKDLPCNLQVVAQRDRRGRLDLLVTNRSNDAIWGKYGSDVVHFSMLQEYLSAAIGCSVGRLWQVTTNLHAYDRHWEMVEAIAADVDVKCPYERGEAEPFPMVGGPVDRWRAELEVFMAEGEQGRYEDPFFYAVVSPMARAWRLYKEGDEVGASIAAGSILATDLRKACVEWLGRRRGGKKAR